MSTFQFFRFRSQPLDENILGQNCSGQGTTDNPFVIDFLHDDAQDAMNFREQRKWILAVLHSISTLVVTFASSVYASGIEDISQHFKVSTEVATLGLSLFVLGFALGPLIWAPLSELYGRRSIYVVTFVAYTAFSVAATCSPNIQSLLILRFLASAFGSSSMTNTGGMVSDMFSREKRGVATGLAITAPFLGPALGPIVGGFLNLAEGWRWILGLVSILAGVVSITTILVTPETYAPFILRCRANNLSKKTGKVYISRLDAGKPPKTVIQELSIALSRPWILLCLEPIVLLMSLYMAIVYGTLYMFFAAIPIVFQGSRGWSPGNAGLPFVGVAIGVCLATVITGIDNKRYTQICKASATAGKPVEPEARLSTAMGGSVVLPIALFLFAWTTYPAVHWIAPVIGAMLFACGLVLVFISQMCYLIDSYTIYAASVLATGSMLRSLFGTAFPLFTTQMYARLGDQWASSIPAFLVTACVPIPFLFHKYGPRIRSKCKFAAEAAKVLDLMRLRQGLVMDANPDARVKNNEDDRRVVCRP